MKDLGIQPDIDKSIGSLSLKEMDKRTCFVKQILLFLEKP
ncbi:hypothetical protein T472_0201720 [Youngiibacter fragilis 232.1]|uniref:Uncharacterized protein n=1 Tax=Youngiibacter fragilis 232.1 TaxID=994573 RepID=V7I8Y2_9CLOT|nr:hypothetical protein T472_0201720 [Youngiibacter fragilis 232.1]